MPDPGLLSSLRALYATFSSRLRLRMFVQLGLTLVGAFAELALIGAVIPFLTFATASDTSSYPAWLMNVMDRSSQLLGVTPVEAAAILLMIVAVGAGAVRLLLTWTTQRFAFAIGYELSSALYSRVLHRPYSYHVNHNSAHFLAALAKVQHIITMVLLPVTQAFTSVVVAIFILAALVAIDPAIALYTIFGFVIIYLGVSLKTRSRVRRNSRIIADAHTSRIKLIQESLGGIRDVIMGRAQRVFTRLFAVEDSRLRRTQAANHFIAAAPRYVLEAGSVILVAIIVIAIADRPGGLIAALPTLGAFAIGAQRLLPMVQQVYSASSLLEGSHASLVDVLALIESKDGEAEANRVVAPVAFTRSIAIRGVSFTYPGANEPALERIELVIERGDRVGFVGATGSGKSTLVDLLMGLLRPTSGTIEVDGIALHEETTRGWQAHVAHVPQAIFLSDSSVRENIAFAIPPHEIDRSRVEEVARLADVHQVIEQLPEAYDSLVGEKGVRLSGGQRQRIGIARALYQNTDVLVLDEATSALDEATEATVMASIAGLRENLTVLIVAHRLSTLRMCDRIVRLEQGRIVEVGDYASVVSKISAADDGGLFKG